jgi:hypothetical protein
MDMKIGPILMGLAYLGVVVFLIVFCAAETRTFDDYSKYWGLFATLVGVATGAIPSFFFKTQADKATDRADKEATKAQLYAAAVEPASSEQIRRDNPRLFE